MGYTGTFCYSVVSSSTSTSLFNMQYISFHDPRLLLCTKSPFMIINGVGFLYSFFLISFFPSCMLLSVLLVAGHTHVCILFHKFAVYSLYSAVD